MIPEKGFYKRVDELGTVCHYLNGKLHRTDGPAVLWSDGFQSWWQNGMIHRIDGPAVSSPKTGYQEYRTQNKLHRIGGPAVIFPDGSQEYWIHGVQIKNTNKINWKKEGF